MLGIEGHTHQIRAIFKDIYFGPEEMEESPEGGTLASLMAEVEADEDTGGAGSEGLDGSGVSE